MELLGAKKNTCKTVSLIAVGLFSNNFLLTHLVHPGDFRSWESPQTLPALLIGHFDHVERFRNLKFAVKRITDIQSTVLSSSEGTAVIHLAFK